MAIRLIPLKNSLIDNEEKYLTDMLKKTWFWKRKGGSFINFHKKQIIILKAIKFY